MDNLKCNRLTCRKALTEKAVVTTCSHIFCVECANELFNASRLCPACETSLTEPDDVVVCSLHPSNDYKTSVLSGLNPATIVEICSRAMSFWQYQVHQEFTFQHAVLRSVNEKNAQLQKQLDNVIREANSEMSLLNNKISELERDLELERRQAASSQDTLREREKEYQKLKAQFDKIKRKALLAPGGVGGEHLPLNAVENDGTRQTFGDPANRLRGMTFAPGISGPVDVGAVVGDMEANGIQRTPIVNRTNATAGLPQHGSAWRQPVGQPRHQPQRQPFNATGPIDYNSRSNSRSRSARSDSSTEVENMLGAQPGYVRTGADWSLPNVRSGHRGFVQPSTSTKRPPTYGKFRPAGSTLSN